MGVVEYMQETRAELKKVNWPVRRQVAAFTVAIVAVSILLSLVLGVFDFAFSRALGQMLLFKEKTAITPKFQTTGGVPEATSNTDLPNGDMVPAKDDQGVIVPENKNLPIGGTLPILPR